MDSLTQILLGAAVGELTLGHKVGNRAILWGAIAGTIPDLDIICGFFVDDLTKNEWHRGFSHSLLFHLMFAPVLARLLMRIYQKDTRGATKWDWTKLFFWSMFTHALLDTHTSWGTQLLWPLPWKYSWNNIFVADPLYTIPLLGSILTILFIRRGSGIRRRVNNWGLYISSAYMLVTLIFKGVVHQKFTDALIEQEVEYWQISTRPTPLNSILWNANVEIEEAYLIGDYSLFDTSPIDFIKVPLRHDRIAHIADHPKLERLYHLTEGEYAITTKGDTLIYNDLRFGMFGIPDGPGQFVFAYKLIPDGEDIRVEEIPPPRPQGEEAKELFQALWNRIWGE